MRSAQRALVVALALLVVLPTAQASLTTVLRDPTGDRDVAWSHAGELAGTGPLRPIRDAAFERNGTAVDVREIRVGEDASRVFLEVELVDLPPDPAECRGGPEGVVEDAVGERCAYSYVVRWVYYRRADPWGPMVEARWMLGCPSECVDRASVRVGDGPTWSADGERVDFERRAPDVARWTIDKVVFREGFDGDDEGGGDHPEPGPCAGDAFFDFRFESRGDEEYGLNHYKDRRWQAADPAAFYLLQVGDEACTDAEPEPGERVDPLVRDPSGDVAWAIHVWPGVDGPPAAEPVRDAVFPRNGTAADGRAVDVRENRTHLFFELVLEELPPPPSECEPPPGAQQAARCRWYFTVTWSLFLEAGPSAPEGHIGLLGSCRGGCGEHLSFRFSDLRHGKALPDLLELDRVPPDTYRWTVDKRLMQRHPYGSDGELRPAVLCRGDALLDIRFDSSVFDEYVLNRYDDARDTHEAGIHLIEHDSPGCPTAGPSGPTVEHDPASSGAMGLSPSRWTDNGGAGGQAGLPVPGPGTASVVIGLVMAAFAVAFGRGRIRRG